MKLIDKLKKFVDSKARKKNIDATIEEIREVFKPKPTKGFFSKLKHFIFNSVWNRTPNFNIKSVLMDKLEYAFKIGSGIASFNQLPISWIEDKIFNMKSFLAKDRGHITTLTCSEYATKFPLSTIEKVVNNLITMHKVEGWKNDYSLSYTMEILNKVSIFILESKTHQKKAGIRKVDQKLSIKDICESVPSFGNELNGYVVSIEVRRESIWAHMKEILQLNNNFNKWIEFQKAFLKFVESIMRTDGDDKYLRTTFNLDAIRTHIDSLPSFIGSSSILVFSNAIANYKKKVSEYREIIPLRFLGLRKLATFKDRAPHYYTSKESEITKQLTALHSSSVETDDAKFELNVMDMICKSPLWKEYETRRKELLSSISDSTDTNNLENARPDKEDFGMACVDAVMELRDSIPGMKGRKLESQISEIVSKFVTNLTIQLEEVVEDDTLFSCGASMDNRFNKIIYPTYQKVVKQYNSGESVSKSELFKLHLDTHIRPHLNGQTKFDILKLTNESYKDLETTWVDFGKDNQSEANMDLGQKVQAMGYTVDNTLAQQKHHNRSSDGDHNVNTLEYWKWYSEVNLKLVNDNKDKLIANGEFKVLSDAQILNERFN